MVQIFARCGEAGTLTLSVPAGGSFEDVRAALLRKRPKLTTCADLCFTFGGRSCEDGASLAEAGVQRDSTVEVQRRLRGGGGDGGATGAESRSSYLEMYMSKKPDKVDPNEERLAKWTRCQLSGEPLTPPCVADELGHLFNKDAVVAALVAKSMPKPLGHISSLKHLIDLRLERNPNYRPADPNDAAAAPESKYCCPVTGQDFNGRFRFVALRPSGHVVSERAIKQVPAAVEDHVGAKWKAAMPINGTEEEMDSLREAMLKKRAAEKVGKAAEKAAKKALKAGKVSSASPAVEIIAESGRAGRDVPSAAQAAALLSASADEVRRAAQKWPKRDLQAPHTSEETAQRKKFKAAEHVPEGADKRVWASIFTSSSGPVKETYGARSIGARFL